ncbi:MAG: hypothetical protein ABGZ37_05915, partial [Akkermansiaceae bacterium]
MTKFNLTLISATVLIGAFLGSGWIAQGLAKPAEAAGKTPAGSPNAPAKIGHPSFLSPHASPIALHGKRLFVVNTPSDTVDV